MPETLVAWMHWDPDPIAFFVPLIKHPVKWYGIFFMLGFAISYFMMVWLLAYKLGWSRSFGSGDVHDWSALIRSLQKAHRSHDLSSLDHLLSHLSARELQQLDSWKEGETVEPALQKAVLRCLNQAMQSDAEFDGKRTSVEALGLESLTTVKQHAYQLTDRLIVYIILATIIGARLGHVLFYDLDRTLENPWEVFKVWEGGLASHGGALGILLALALFYRRVRHEYPTIGLLNWLDYLALCTGLVGAFIRFGNFVNQEILGTVTTVPWAVVFGHPMGAQGIAPRHPVQLYESVFYLCVFGALLKLWLSWRGRLQPGRLFGLCFLSIFTFRFFVEFWKEPQSLLAEQGSYLLMGQWLSLPFILVGLYFSFSRKNLMDPRSFS